MSDSIYKIQCARCHAVMETTTPPKEKHFYLCNCCQMGWKDIESKLIGHTYQDELNKALVNYVNSKPWSVGGSLNI